MLGVVFADGFDHYLNISASPLGFASQWTLSAADGNAAWSFETPGLKGRGKAIKLDSAAGGVLGIPNRYFRGIPSTKQISQHMALRMNTINTGVIMPLYGWYDVNNACQFSLYMQPAGFLALYRGLGTTLLATSAYAFTNGIVHRLNLAMDFTNPVSGSAQLWIDGDASKGFSIAATDLLATAQDDVRAVTLERGNLTYSYTTDDYMFCNGDSINIGEMELITQGPISDVQKQWTPLTGVDNFAMVDEIPPDADASYNSSTVVGNVDLQGFPALPVSPDSIFCVTQIIGARKEESGTRGINAVLKQTGEHDGAEQNLSTDYVWYYENYLKNPETLAAWLAADRLAASWGYKDAL